MKVYEIETDSIVYKKVVLKNNSTYFLCNLDEDTLNSIGYLKVDDSNAEYDDNFVYYRKVLSVYGNKCIIKYYKEDRTIDEVKELLINNVKVFIGEDTDKINEINNCTTIDELKVIEPTTIV